MPKGEQGGFRNFQLFSGRHRRYNCFCAPNPPNPLCIQKCTVRFYYRARGMKPVETQTVVQSLSPLAESLPWKTDDECQRGSKGDSETFNFFQDDTDDTIASVLPIPLTPFAYKNVLSDIIIRQRGMKPVETQTVVQGASPLAESLPWKTDD